ncbi:MAG TPA: diguanylate cyclase [Candidatus Omnitrophota bacterium]|nr:diguanylate cyclase [Candidatus Omnitrophota bacterium]
MLPPYFIPITAFALWFFVVISYLPVLRLELNLTDQTIAPYFFLSYLILVFSWALSGPIAAAVLSILAAMTALYLSLSAKEPVMFLQALLYGALFLFMVSYLHRVQDETNDRKISREKLAEEVHLTTEEIQKKIELKKALEEKIDRLLDLQRFAKDLKQTDELHGVAQKVVDEAYSVLGKADECALYLVNESKQGLSLVASTRHGGEGVRQKEGTLFDQWVMRRSQAIMIEDTQNDFRFPKETVAGQANLRSVCVSPMLSENKVLGVLRASSNAPDRFNADDLRLLDIFSSLGSVTLKNILLYEKMEELAIRDSLTGLYLNRHFQERLAEEVQRAHFNRARFALILLDIDYFKRFNDEYGHAAGDIVLRNIAAIILKCVERHVDLVARYGGEEIAILLPGKTRKDALVTAEKIRREVESAKFAVRRVETKVTVSMGVAEFPEGGRTKEELLWKVDKNLYEAKSQGRNRVCGDT